MSVKIKDGKLRYAPGESGVVRAEFRHGKFLRQSRQGGGAVARQRSAGQDPPSLSRSGCTYRCWFPLEPEDPEMGSRRRSSSRRSSGSRMNHDKPIRVTGVTAHRPMRSSLRLKTIEEGKSYELIVTPIDIQIARPWRSSGSRRIATSTKHRIQQAFAVVRKPTPAGNRHQAMNALGQLAVIAAVVVGRRGWHLSGQGAAGTPASSVIPPR